MRVVEMTPEMLAKMMQEHQELNPDRPVRLDTQNALNAYAPFGHRLGDFLTAVVENDLFEAVGRADSYNLATLPQIVRFIWNEWPATCPGSPEKVSAHYKSFQGEP